MGVCAEERPVMHWQQSARFLGPSIRDKYKTPPVFQQVTSQKKSSSQVVPFLSRSCSSCSEFCDHSNKSFVEPITDSLKRKNQADFIEINDETSSGNILKTEPYGSPSSPESVSEVHRPRPNKSENCAGCGLLIQDRFYLLAVEKRWHVNCLQCYACRLPLDRESSCFSRDGNIYCKIDYYSCFGTRRCSKCLASISSTELVMRAKNLVFHINCFCCVICLKPLTKGDQFGIIDSLIYCRTHYNIAREKEQSLQTQIPINCFMYSSPFETSQNDSCSPHPDSNRDVPSGHFVPSTHIISGLPQPPRQKGRPRKRKPKDLDSLTVNIDLNTDYYDLSRGPHMNASSRTKRMRTSFKHHQLRTMKSYFAINHNPDAKDLKQLSQKTGLPKRVLQVWFQNARAKWRRMMMKQDGTNTIEKSDGSIDLDISSSSPGQFLIGRANSSPTPSTID